MFYHEFIPQPRTEGDDVSQNVVPTDGMSSLTTPRSDVALKKLATDFVNLSDELERLGREADRAKIAVENAAIKFEECKRELKKCVGSNIKERHILTSPNKLVVVQMDKVEIKNCI